MVITITSKLPGLILRTLISFSLNSTVKFILVSKNEDWFIFELTAN